jgi:hypothetical protein
MNTFANHPSAAIEVANRIVFDRVQQAQARADARAMRAKRRAGRAADPATPISASRLWWAFRSIRTAS